MLSRSGIQHPRGGSMSAQRGGRSASRVILLTGASGGIGRATASRCANDTAAGS
jgi:hypothetical protein